MKLKVIPDPEFNAVVKIPVPGKDAVAVKMRFRYKTKTELAEWRASLDGKADADAILEIVASWEFDDPLNIENIEWLDDKYQGSIRAITQSYLLELAGARAKN